MHSDSMGMLYCKVFGPEQAENTRAIGTFECRIRQVKWALTTWQYTSSYCKCNAINDHGDELRSS